MQASIITLLLGALAAALGTDMGLRNGYAGILPTSPDHAPPDPAFTYTLSCDQWRLEYLVKGGELSLWTSCYARQPDTQSVASLPKGAELYVISRLALDSSYVANEYAIRAASPSNSAPVSFSSLCHDCSLYNGTTSVMTCNCTTNNGHPPMSVDLGLSIAGMPDGVPCFTDGVVCAVQQSVSTKTLGATASAAKEKTSTPDSTIYSTTLLTTTSSPKPSCTNEN
ncbi:hypothetical protein F503_07162 [Ophiostoma piceae UAMH 11346]|uniref:Cyanovirin-N domain-containing protein n=1 Tax=Ophiostoma piceae (strain UAMH 11346) TaxID=1262450 RepID=S3CBP1_OPHP1|nr:hypothetical protein F503_07162 [Ophiostoma piceae UAMH 11346]